MEFINVEEQDVPLEDGAIRQETINSIWPSATGLKYVAESGRTRVVQKKNNHFVAPPGGWEVAEKYYAVIPPQQEPTRKPLIGCTC